MCWVTEKTSRGQFSHSKKDDTNLGSFVSNLHLFIYQTSISGYI